MGVERNEDVTCIYIFICTHQLYNLHARLYIALYQFHPTAACRTSLDLITCWKIFSAANGRYIIKKKSLAMAQATFRSANCKMLVDDLFLSRLFATCAPQTALAAGGNIVRLSEGGWLCSHLKFI